VTSRLDPIASGVRRSPLASFVVLAYALSWAWAFPFVAAGDVVKKGVGWPTHFPALLGPALAALVMTALLWGRAGVRDLLARMASSRMPLRWWAAALSPAAFLCQERRRTRCPDRASVHTSTAAPNRSAPCQQLESGLPLRRHGGVTHRPTLHALASRPSPHSLSRSPRRLQRYERDSHGRNPRPSHRIAERASQRRRVAYCSSLVRWGDVRRPLVLSPAIRLRRSSHVAGQRPTGPLAKDFRSLATARGVAG
jgi:hypothetical protein